MALPPRAFFTLHETASRWGCTIADIAGWAAVGKLDIVTGIPLAICGTDKVSGKVFVSPMDMLPLFRRSGTGPTSIKLLRVKPDPGADWIYVTEPADGVDVSIADLLISGQDVLRFEDEYDLLRRIGGGTGALSPYDWEGMYVAMIKRIHEHGLPATQAELIGELQEWFGNVAESGDVPDESTIRRRLRPFWRALRGEN
ncbi:hypothetical protein [Pseudotabrizicola algicola]|uniref:Uncharacterized protein n=1 Tax=Pseudotabrizicola algicola TaxID=2709381 RepID=A0A6B3RWI6_9RHOB|nr:hypothetical protein [Pseudotabrizicola algicola]NEX48195.1 hypothetical protein [Pseudotabrizicola algicola]